MIDYKVILFFFETVVKEFGEFLTVKVASDWHDFFHAVTIGVVPVAAQVGIVFHHLTELGFGSCCKPVAGLGDFLL